MIRLLSSEALRIRSRRALWVIALVAAAGIAIGIGIGTANSHPPSATAEAQAQRRYERERAACLSGAYGEAPPEFPGLASYCDEVVQPEMFQGGGGLRLSGLNGLIQGMATLTALVGVVIAASLVGADWSSGSMATLLTWEPRRIVVFVVRTILVAVTVFALSILLLAFFASLFRLGVALRGSTAGAQGWLGDVAGSVLRVGVVATLYGLFAYALASIGRSTAAGLGIMLGELVLVEGFLRGFRPSIEGWLSITNAVAIVSGEAQQLGFADMARPDVLTVGRAAVTLSAYVLAALVVAALVFRARDVT